MFEQPQNKSLEDSVDVLLFQGTKNFADIHTILMQQPIATADGNPYTVTELETAISRARESRFSVMNRFTRNHGLREQAAKLFIAEAANFEELSQLLKEIDSIENEAGEMYNKLEILNTIQGYLNNEKPIEALTRAYGIRSKVAELKATL